MKTRRALPEGPGHGRPGAPRWTGLLLPLLLALCLLPVGAQAAQGEGTFRFQAAEQGGQVNTQQAGTARCLFLPSHAALNDLTLWFDGGDAVFSRGERSVTVKSGVPFDLTPLFPYGPEEGGRYPVSVLQGGARSTLTILKSDRIRSLYLTSGDPAQDRAWVEESKSNKAKDVSLLLLGPDGHVVWQGGVKNLKGRGNSTWLAPKKPYQIKLEKKADLLETGDPAEANGTWVLLANYCDPSMLHNTLTFALGEALGLPYTPRSQPVDLYYDGEYRGTYFLSEKTEVGPGRVAIRDLEEAIEAANPDVGDMDALPARVVTDGQGRQKSFVPGLLLPEDWSGGYLLELDYPERAREEKSWFQTAQGAWLVVKSPEDLPEEALNYIEQTYQRFEDAVYHDGVDPATGRDYRQLADVRSLAACYLLFELSEDVDAYQSSTYFYKKQGDDLLYAGPLWDFDQGYGSGNVVVPDNSQVAGKMYLARALLTLPTFQQAVKDLERELHPLLTGIILPEDQELVLSGGGVLTSLSTMAGELAASQQMNAVLWPEMAPRSYDRILEELTARLRAREAWLHAMVTGWTGAPPEEQETFSDVPKGKWYHDAVEEMVQRGVFTGVTGFSFAPNQTMTRAMLVTTLYRLTGSPGVDGKTGFSDVNPDSWYGPAAAWAREKGVAQGDETGRFRPNDSISRQDLMVFLHRTAGAAPSSASLKGFADGASVSAYARTALSWGVENGLLQGDKKNRLLPGGSATRAQCAVILQRYLHL